MIYPSIVITAIFIVGFANIMNLFAQLANFVGFTATNGTISNATTSNFATGNLTATGTATLANANIATATVGTETVSSSSITWANIQNLFAQVSNLVNLVATNATLTNATTTNLASDRLTLASTTASTTANTLYNQGGQLYFNGAPIGTLTQSAISTTTNAQANYAYSIDATLSGIILNLPAAPQDGTVIQIKDVKGLFSTNPVLVQASTTVDDVAGSGGVSLTTAYGVTTLYYNAANTTWNVNTALPTPTTLGRARMTKTVAQNVTNTTAKVTFTSTPSYNIGNIGDSATSRVTVAQSGIYAVNANIEVVAPSTGTNNVCAIVYLNGAPANMQQCLPANFSNGSTYQLSFSDVLNLSAGDYLEVFLQNQNGVAAQVTAANSSYTVQQQPTAAVSIQSTAASYIMAKKISADAPIAVGSPFPFDTVANTAGSDITLSNPTFTLKAGHTYQLQAGLAMTDLAATSSYQWRDTTNAQYLGIAAVNNTTGSTGGSDQQVASAIVTPTTDITVELWNTSSGSRTFTAANSYSFINEIAGNSPVTDCS
jgi:hypothetical protein